MHKNKVSFFFLSKYAGTLYSSLVDITALSGQRRILCERSCHNIMVSKFDLSEILRIINWYTTPGLSVMVFILSPSRPFTTRNAVSPTTSQVLLSWGTVYTSNPHFYSV